jgi:hypothetical protein
MTTEAFRSAVFADLEAWRVANYPTLAVVTENGPEPDESTLQVWLDAEIRWYGAGTASIEGRPVGRHTGTLSLQVFYRQGEGTQLPDQILDSLQERFRNRRIGGGVVRFAQRSVPSKPLGWLKTGLFFPFHLDVF